ncbi:D-alanyl-D-alanine carboxypeptidase/D-alanyl-D-alanine-endopeptidase [Mycobacteroides abscessus subsp. abscessus]|nr:D-alanyl-D-alanine carboxypeptidase/D-alanyl-D-alanine-endopeptidase [Mycobacteroides abscessus subsp. abscessus]
MHAKTGTLSEVSSLSGWTVTASGQSVIIVFIVNQSKDDWWARAWIDTAAAVVSECGCP